MQPLRRARDRMQLRTCEAAAEASQGVDGRQQRWDEFYQITRWQ